MGKDEIIDKILSIPLELDEIINKILFCSHLFFRQNFPLCRQILCIKYKNVNKLRKMIRNCE